jgi:predicted nucleic acid-binding protein
MTFVLDASVALSWVLGDERSETADAVLDRLKTERALVPSLWVAEVANGLVAAERRRRIDAGDVSLAIELLDELPIEVVPESRDALEPIRVLAMKHGLTAYDAAYLHLAVTARAPVATLDDDLVRAARAARVRRVIRNG